MKCVILAGGRGTRIAEEANTRPKPMGEIGTQPSLWHIMKLYASFGVREFVVCLGYKGYVIKEYFANYFLHQADVTFDMTENRVEYHDCRSEPWKVTLVDTGEESMTGGRLLQVRKYLNADEPLCMTYGDGLANRYRCGACLPRRSRPQGHRCLCAAAGAVRPYRHPGYAGRFLRGEADRGRRPDQRRVLRPGAERARIDRRARYGLGKRAHGEFGRGGPTGCLDPPRLLAADGHLARQAKPQFLVGWRSRALEAMGRVNAMAVSGGKAAAGRIGGDEAARKSVV